MTPADSPTHALSSFQQGLAWHGAGNAGRRQDAMSHDARWVSVKRGEGPKKKKRPQLHVVVHDSTLHVQLDCCRPTCR